MDWGQGLVLHVLICEDNLQQRVQIDSIAKEHIAKKDYDMQISLSTADPTVLLDHLREQPKEHALYFLDVDLQHTINGIELGAKIREDSQHAKIVFITTHDEMAYLTFRHKIDAMDYIVKGQPQKMKLRIEECIDAAYERHQEELSAQEKYFTINMHGEVFNIPHDDIFFFETHPTIKKRIIMHTVDGPFDFRGMIGTIEEHHSEFFLCHKSFVVNVSQIRSIDKMAKQIQMVNGDVVPVATRRMPELLLLVQ